MVRGDVGCLLKRIGTVGVPADTLDGNPPSQNMSAHLQFEYCVPESQRLADLHGAKHDLDDAVRFCDLHIEIDPTEAGIPVEEALRREHTRSALCRAAFISYGRCFATGVRTSLSSDLVERLPADLRGRHAQVRMLRDKWVAHSVNHFDDVRVRIDATMSPAGEFDIRGVVMAAQLVGGFVQAWVIAYRVLFVAVRDLVQKDISVETERLTAAVKRMPPQELMQLERVDGTPLVRKSWDPGQSRGRFRDD